jgi:hypothetical protein
MSVYIFLREMKEARVLALEPMMNFKDKNWTCHAEHSEASRLSIETDPSLRSA